MSTKQVFNKIKFTIFFLLENVNDLTNSKIEKKNDKERNEEEEEEEEDEFYDKTPPKQYPLPATNTLKDLPKFDITEFYNLTNVGADVKELLYIMSK